MSGGTGESSIQVPAADIALPFLPLSHGDHGAVGLKPHRVETACGDLGNVRPVTDIALPVAVVSHCDHGAVGLNPHRVETACGDLGNARPVADIALPFAVLSHGDYGAVGLKPHRGVIAPPGDSDDVRPVADIALPVEVDSHGDNGAVGLNPHRVPGAYGDLDDARPVTNIELPVVVVSHGDHGAVGHKSHRVVVACADPPDVRPASEIALPPGVVSHGHHGAVGLKPHRVHAACGDHKVDLLKVGGDFVVAVRGDDGGGGVDIADGAHIASPVDKLVASIRGGIQANHRANVIGKSPFARDGYIASSGAGDGEVICRHKVGRYEVGAVHGDGGYGGVDIGNAAHIASPVDKAVALLNLHRQVDHCSLVIGKHPFSRGGYIASSSADDSEVISRLSTAYHPGN